MLAQIRLQVEVIVWTDRDVPEFLVVPVQIAEPHDDMSIPKQHPSLRFGRPVQLNSLRIVKGPP